MMREIEYYLQENSPFLPSVDLSLLNSIIRDLFLEQGYYVGEAIVKGLLLTSAVSVMEAFTRKPGSRQEMIESFTEYAKGFNRPLRLLQISFAGLAEGLDATRMLLSKISADAESSFIQENLSFAVDVLDNDHSGVSLVAQVVQRELQESSNIFFQVGLEAARRTFAAYYEILDTLVSNLADDDREKPGPLLPRLREYEEEAPLLPKPLSPKVERLEKTLAQFAENPSCSAALLAFLRYPGLILRFFGFAARLIYNARKNPEAAIREMQKASAVMPKIQEAVRSDWRPGELVSRVGPEFAYMEERVSHVMPQASYPSQDLVRDVQRIRTLSQHAQDGESTEKLLVQWELLAKQPGLEQYSALWTTVHMAWGDLAERHFAQTGEKRFIRIARRAYADPLKKSSVWKADLGTRWVCGARLGELFVTHGSSLETPVPELACAIHDTYTDALQANERLYQRSPFMDSKRKLQSRSNLAVARVLESCFYLSEHNETESPNWRREALVAAENGKSRMLRSEMALAPRLAPPQIPSALCDAEAQLLGRLRRKLANETMRQNYFETDVQSSNESTKEYNELYLELEEIWIQMENHGDAARAYAAVRRDEGIQWDVFQRVTEQLGKRVAIISISRLPEAVALSVLRAGYDAPQVQVVSLPRDRLLHYLHNYDAEMLNRSALPSDWWKSHPPTNEWQKLGETLLAPLESLLNDVECVYFLPHGPFHRLPLHALTINGTPLINQRAVAYAPSISVLESTLARPRGEGPALVMAYAPFDDPRNELTRLIYSEADEVAAHLHAPAPSETTSGELLTRYAPSSRLIHISCHGSFDPRDPLNSGINLADGVYTARDWLQLQLRADLVTLSACETGTIKYDEGDDIVGLMRAVLFAGAASLLITLERVNAKTTHDWMIEFYRHAWNKDGLQVADKAAAFREATLKLQQREPDPYYWAPFVLVGNFQ